MIWFNDFMNHALIRWRAVQKKNIGGNLQEAAENPIEEIELMPVEIGMMSGKIWQLMGKKNKTSTLQLIQLLKEDVSIMYQALG